MNFARLWFTFFWLSRYSGQRYEKEKEENATASAECRVQSSEWETTPREYFVPQKHSFGRHCLCSLIACDMVFSIEKMDYLRNAVTGLQVAFLHPSTEIVMNGKIISNDGNQFLSVIIGKDKVIKIHYDHVLWVKTSTRWPSWVYKLLKKNTNSNLKNF